MSNQLPVTSQIAWVYTLDLDGTCAFYSQVLGLALSRDEGDARIYATGMHSAIGVCRAMGSRIVQPAGGMITLATGDVDGWYERLRRAGATLRGAPERHEGFGIYGFVAQDPNGYLIEFQAFLDAQDAQ